jgi:hypothetical protein
MYFPVRPQRISCGLYDGTGTIGIPGGFAAAEFDFRCGALIFLADRGFKLLA